MSPPRYGRAFWIALPIGAGLMAFGAVGLVGDSGVGAGVEVGGWLVGADVAGFVAAGEHLLRGRAAPLRIWSWRAGALVAAE